MQHKVGYVKGINKDLAKDKYGNQNYFDANNIKVVTDAGMSTGSIENEKGNSLLFQFPTVGARYLVTIASADVVIGGNTVTLSASDSIEGAYNKIIGNAGVAGLISNNQVYIFFNDTGVYIQVMDTAFTVTGSVTTYSAATSTIYICGWTRLNDWIIVFTSNSETANPSGALCQIWKFKFTSGSRTTISGASGITLDATEHLIYNDFLNYSTETYIRDIVANYETSSKGRVYFTDYYNQVRVANVLDEELMSTKVNDMGLVSEVTLSKPVIIDVSNNGSLPAGAQYQYYYKLIAQDGRESIFSPGSQIIDVQEELSNDTGVNYHDLDSTPADQIDNKELTIRIEEIDTDYDLLELYCVIWFSTNSPSIYKVDEETISGTSTTIVHNNLDSGIILSQPEFMSIGLPFTCKTLEDRDKQLVAGNIKESAFDLDFDARAYRFNALGVDFTINDSDGTSDSFALTFGSNFSNIPETHACINPTNDDSNTGYNIKQTSARQIYQQGGSVIGGTGPNVSYKFGTTQRIGSTGVKALKDASSDESSYNPNTYRSSSAVGTGVYRVDGTSIDIQLADEFVNGKSSMLNSIHTGYARGEVYRFGIVFYSKTGQRSYVKWIGDIKMPDPSYDNSAKIGEGSSNINAVLDHQSGVDTYTYNLYPIFTVDISSIKSQISGFEIVRVHRSSSDMTRLGTGVITNFVNYGQTGSVTATGMDNSLIRTYNVATTTPANFYAGSTRTFGNSNNPGTKISSTIKVGTTVYGDSGTTGGSLTLPNATLMLADYPTLLRNRDSADLTLANTIEKQLLNFHSPIADFRDYTGFNINTSTDYLQDFGYYKAKPFVYHDHYAFSYAAPNGDLNDFDLGFMYRGGEFVSLGSASETVQFYEIEKEKVLEQGEVLFPSDDILSDLNLSSTNVGGHNIEAVCNTTYSYYDRPAAENDSPFGIGTRKQLIRIPAVKVKSFCSNADDLNDFSGAGVTLTSAGDWANYHQNFTTSYTPFKEVAYCRLVTNQYGGNSYEDRSKNEYISTGAYQIVDADSATSLTVGAFGGDVYTTAYDKEYVKQYNAGIFTDAPIKSPSSSRMSIGMVFACEAPINTAFRKGRHWGGEDDIYFRGSIANDGTRTPNDFTGDEQFEFDFRHFQSNNLRTDYLAKDLLTQDETIFPNRVKVSRTKVDGELIDSWRSFPANQYDHVDGSLGEIHKLISFKDQLIFFQDRGIGMIPINERAVIEDVTGAELVLGDGQLIGKYRYLTETSGTKHQHSVITTDRAVYYYDSLQQKIYMLQGESLTEALGLHDYFHHNIKEILRDSDDLYVANPTGVHAVYDAKNERVLWTFLGANNIRSTTRDLLEYYEVGDIVLTAEGYIQCIVQGEYLPPDVITTNGNFEVLSNYYPGFTLGYREKLQAFESFYSFKPGKFLGFDDKLLSIDPSSRNIGYVHEEGNYNNFYGNSYSSDITLVVMPNPNIISIFNNLEYYSQVTIDGKDILDSTLDSILCWNEYQNTGQVTLTVGTLAKRRMRTWRHKLKRDILSTDNLNSLANPRLRNYFIFLKVKFDTSTNERLVLSDVVISYTPTRM